MEKLKLFAFTLIAFLCFGVISVNAERVEVNNVAQYKAEITKESSATVIVLGADLDISNNLNGNNNEDQIHVNRNIVLDLNGHTISTGDRNNGGNSAEIDVWYYGNYTLTIKNSLETGGIHSFCYNSSFFDCSVSPIVLSFTDECNKTTSNCDAKLILQDITISTSNKNSGSNFTFDYLMNIGTPANLPENKSKYNVEISNVELENEKLVKQLFAHNFAYNSTSPILALNIKSIKGTNVKYVNKSSEYKVKDILDQTISELLVNGTVITDPEMKISNYDVSAGFEIREKSIIDVIFNDTQYGYSGVSAKPITIKNNNLDLLKVKSVTVSDTNKFTISGNTQPTIAVGSTDNSSFSIKPVDGLGVGEHTAIITVTDMDNKTYTANVKFIVVKADIEPVVSITGWSYGTTANSPSVTGNTGNGSVTYEYKVKDAEDNTYVATVPTAVGEYTIRATVGATTNYNGGVATASFIIEYKVTDGDGQKHIIGKTEDAVFRIDADKDLFLKAYLNGEELDSTFYTVTEGSTIITLKQEFLNKLLPDTYNLKTTFSDGGEANMTFVIEQSVENNPKTSDSILKSIIFEIVSLIGLFSIGIYMKKENYN